MNSFTDEELKRIKDHCNFQSNNCGGCETCSQTFGTEVEPYDYYETWILVSMIEQAKKDLEAANKKIVELTEERRVDEKELDEAIDSLLKNKEFINDVAARLIKEESDDGEELSFLDIVDQEFFK